jgi:hypothetical protein
MKYWLKLLLIMLFCGAPFSVWSAAPETEFLVVNPDSKRLEVVDSTLKSVAKLHFRSKPLKLKRLSEQHEYLLLLQGSKNSKKANRSAALVYYDRMFRPTGRRVELPGAVVTEEYLDQVNLWLIVTSQAKQTILNLVNPNSGVKSQFGLEAPPDLLELSPDGTRLALGVADPQSGPTIKLIDLKQSQIQNIPVPIFPGALYFGNPDQIIVAGSTARPSRKWFLGMAATNATPADAQLITINIESGQSTSLPLGKTPVTIIQDQNNSAVFYSLNNNISAQQQPAKSNNDSKTPSPAATNSTLRIINQGKESAQFELTGAITRIVQAPSGNICLLGQSRFLIFDPQAKKLIANIGTESKFVTVSFSPSGNLGFLLSEKGCRLQLIDLLSGKQLTKVESSQPSLIDQLQTLDISPYLFRTTPPAVSGTSRTITRQPTTPANRQVIVDETRGRIYQLASRRKLSIIDLKTNQPVNTVKLKESVLGFHLIPHSNYLALVTKQTWYLIDPQKTAPVLTVKINLSNGNDDRHIRIAQTGYYSPDGTRLAISCNNRIYLVKTDTCQLLGQIRIKTAKPMIFWP